MEQQAYILVMVVALLAVVSMNPYVKHPAII